MIVGQLKIYYPSGNKNYIESCQKDEKTGHQIHHKNMNKKSYRLVNIDSEMLKHSSLDKIIADLISDDNFATNKSDYSYTKI